MARGRGKGAWQGGVARGVARGRGKGAWQGGVARYRAAVIASLIAKKAALPRNNGGYTTDIAQDK